MTRHNEGERNDTYNYRVLVHAKHITRFAILTLLFHLLFLRALVTFAPFLFFINRSSSSSAKIINYVIT